MIYVYYSAPYQLPMTFTSPEFYNAMRYDKDCRRIIENTGSHKIIIGNKTPVTLEQKNCSNGRYGLMKKLVSALDPECTVVMPDIMTLSSDTEEAKCLYESFIDKGIDLEFTDSPWLNTNTIRLLLQENRLEAKNAAATNIVKTMEWKEKSDRSNGSWNQDVCISQASTKVKKNGH